MYGFKSFRYIFHAAYHPWQTGMMLFYSSCFFSVIFLTAPLHLFIFDA